jgi:hypothetical protein
MTETDAIVGIYGAVDRAVQSDPQARARVATLLDQYRDPQFHWFDEFQEWLGIEQLDNAEAPPDQLEAALGQLAEAEPSRPRARARRMFAVAAATRAFSQLQKPKTTLAKLAVNALHPTSIESEEPDEAGKGLYDLLRSEQPPSGEYDEEYSWWDSVIATAVANRLLPDPPVGMHPQPCSGRLVDVPGVAGPVAALRTDLEIRGIPFAAATRLIEPVNWKDCMPNFWCEVHEIGNEVIPGERCYHEVVGSNCSAGPGGLFWAETDLLFNFMWLPDRNNAEAALTNYQLAPGRPLPNDLIRVDEGTLLVAKINREDEHLMITTTKRIQFNWPFSSEVLAMIMCALGYADVAGSLACCTARRGMDPNDAAGLTEFPGVSPPAATAAAAGPGPRADADDSRGGYGPTNLGELAQDAAGIWARALRDGAAALERGAGRQGRQPPGAWGG